MKNRTIAIAIAAVMAGCAGESPAPDAGNRSGSSEKPEMWSSSDAPSLLGSSLVFNAASLPSTGQAAAIPWAGSYWPSYNDSINYRWDGPGSNSPSMKYQIAFGGSGVEDSVSAAYGIDAWSARTACTSTSQCNTTIGETCAMRNGQSSGRCIPTWFGICHAWAAAAVLLPEPLHPVAYGGVTFKVSDLKALASLVHDRVNLRMVSLRCNASDATSGIAYDPYGRPVAANCRDTNAGTFHVLVTNYLGLRSQGIIYDRVFDDQVWNQPIRGYTVNTLTEVSASEAERLVTGSAGSYTFDPSATRFFHVIMDLDYITEAAPWTDGNLSSVIDFYTGVDRFDYVLEADASGNIIGGEWVGSSKRLHPDFVWLPISPALTTVANGAISYANVKTLMDMSVTGGGGSDGGGGGGTPQNQGFTDGQNVARSEWRYYGPYHVTSGGTLTATLSGNFDADLYVRVGAAPTYSAYDCRPYTNTSNESCTVSGPGDVYVAVNGYAALSWYTLTVNWSSDGSNPTPPPAASLDQSGSVAQGAWRYFALDVQAGQTVVVRTFSSTDVDLYLRLGSTPSLGVFDARAWTYSGNETLAYTASASGKLNIGVYGYAPGTSSFRVTVGPN